MNLLNESIQTTGSLAIADQTVPFFNTFVAVIVAKYILLRMALYRVQRIPQLLQISGLELKKVFKLNYPKLVTAKLE